MADSQNEEFVVEREILDGFIVESFESLDPLDALFVELENNPANIELIHPIFRAMHSLKGNAPFFGLMKVKQLAHDIENILVGLREKKYSAHSALINHILTGVDLLRKMLRNVQGRKPEVESAAVLTEFFERSKAVCSETPVIVPIPEQNPTKKEAETAPSPTAGHAGESLKTMRITEERIDTFLSFVGELIVVSEMLRHFETQIKEVKLEKRLQRDFGQINELFTSLSTELEKAIMSVRRVSVKSLLQRVPRIVRDVASLRMKDIKVELYGESVEIDKSLLELLEAPLMHMVRNAADHGVEPPDLRIKNGKTKEGKIIVRFEETSTSIVLSVEDDGAGLNYEKLQEKALAIGLIQPGQTLGQREVIELLFLPGVSTAQEVSEISGRGVGMDVVKKSIELAGGSIEVESEQGLGSCFKIILPRTIATQIFQGFIVTVGEGRYVLPLEAVTECWWITPDEIGHVFDRVGYVSRRQKTLPCYSLAEMFGIERDLDSTKERLLVALRHKGQEIALEVDSVLGVRQLVQKNLSNDIVNRAGLFHGATFLGDGSIAFILDLERTLNRHTTLQLPETHRATSSSMRH